MITCIGIRITSLKNLKSRSRLKKVRSHGRHYLTIGFRGKCLGVGLSIPQNWYKAGDSIPITITLIPEGYKKVFPPRILPVNDLDRMDQSDTSPACDDKNQGWRGKGNGIRLWAFGFTNRR